MENEDAPNFSYAYGGAPTSASSWNPALLPDHDEQPAPNAKLGQPSPQIVAQSKPTLEPSQNDDEDDEPPALPVTSVASASFSNGTFDNDPNSDDDFFNQIGSGNSPQEASQPEMSETNGHGVSGVEEDTLVNVTQALNLGEQVLEPVNGNLNDASGAVQEPRDDQDAEHPAENYEHQGENTFLEEAVIESEKLPLVEDPAPAAGDEWGSSGEVFYLGGKSQDLLLETPQADAAGTTVGDNVIGNTTVGGNAGEDNDWGNTDDQDFFGGGASQTVVPQQSTEEGPGAHIIEDSEINAPTGADPAWDLSLDDDFLPDAEETPVFELDDDEGFLEDEPPQTTQPTSSGVSTANRYAPQAAQIQKPLQPAANQYAPQGPQFTNFAQTTQQKPTTTANVAYGGYGQPAAYQQPARPAASSAQSFADKAKGGYHSPYDLPDDVVTTRKRAAPRTATPSMQATPPPPPRSSSIPTSGPPRPLPPSNMSATSLSPPSSSHSATQSQMTGMPKAAAPAKQASSDFFAELPVTTKPKPSGRYTPQQTIQHPPMHHPPPPHHAPPHFPSKERTASWSSLRNEVLPDSGNLVSQLQQPERLPVFPDQPSAPMRANSLPVPQPASAPPPSTRYSPAPPPSAPAASSRYSPAPPSAPAANARYSPAPPQAPQAGTHNRYASEPSTTLPRPPVQPYAPRTSSPLAFHTVPQQQEPTPSAPESHVPHPAVQHAMHSSEGVPRAAFKSPLEGVSEAEEQQQPQQASEVTATTRAETPPLRSGPSSAVGSPRKSLNYIPQYQPQQPIPSSVVPPPRSSSQSPSAAMKQPRSFSVSDRPASSHAVMSPPQSSYGVQPTVPSIGIVNSIPSRRQMSHDYECIPPPDERANDPLERWKGYPIFKWGLGGTVVTSFPKQIPRYGGGTSAPVMKISPGEVKIQSAKEVFPMDEENAKFPGPLKGKGKKKDVCTWLGRRIEALEIQLNTPGLEQSMNPDDLKRLEERTLLWKVLQILVDNDGHLEGNPTAEAAVRKVLSINGGDSADGDAPLSTAADLVTRSRSNTVALQAEPVDARAVDDLRTLLTKGDREKAAWHAVDQRLWGHAMLLSSTLSKDVWKQVVQEFVRKEVKKVGRNNQALAMLYEVFAGNHEDCIDELVPASARAGFQMVSTDGAGSEQNALQGLEKWRETLSLVLSNRSEGDATALLSLGKLLAGYGRVEAAHICYIFSYPATYIGGADDAQSDLVLLGADHRQNQLELGIDLEPILLTEVYEFALSLAAPTGSHIIPHLQNYKLAHAYQLAEYGYRTEAQAYCDAITTAMKSTTRISPYYNASFIASLDDLSKRLSQSPKDGSSSWISKPSMDKVSSSLLSKFNSFIAGDDEDAASNHSASGEAGPFAKIAGNSPTTLTPAQSGADLYSAYAGYGVSPAPPSASTNSRYAPSGPYAPKTSMDQPRSRYEPQGRPSMDSNDGSMMGMRATSDSYVPSPQMSGPYSPSLPQLSPGLQRTQAKSHSYSPLRSEQSPAQPAFGNPYEPAPPQVTESAPTFGGYESPQASSGERAPPSLTAYEPPTSSYEPPTAAYEPPSYQPYNADADASSPDEATAKPKKKGFMDDDEDDDLAARAAALKSKQKSEADRKADEAFRAAAEADAKRDKDSAAAKKSGGWFGGWFKKDPNAAPGPIKAKLGDENSFVYDPELKKWVNKKAGAAEPTKPMATPPPPRSGPPSRNISANSMPPSSLPNSNSLSATPAYPPTSNPRSSSMPPPMGIPGSRASTPGIPSDSEGPRPPTLMPPNLPSGPPSRPSTGMSNASSIDDLLGAPQVRKGGASKKKKGGRYVDVMAQGN